jgi:hypothetical protein
LTPDPIQARSSFLFRKVQHDCLKENYGEWLQNDGILAVDKQLKKSFLNATYHDKVSISRRSLHHIPIT